MIGRPTALAPLSRRFFSIAAPASKQPRSRPLFVFLEGPAGAGKGDVCSKLSVTGYTTLPPGSYAKFCASALPSYSPASVLMSMRWAVEIVNQMELAEKKFKDDPQAFKNGLVFVHRSPMSGAVYSNFCPLESHPAYIMMQEIRSAHDTRLVLCQADEYKMQLRMHGEYEQADAANRSVLDQLLEIADEQRWRDSIAKYARLQSDNPQLFDDMIHTTDSKQATSKLLHNLGVTFSLPYRSPSSLEPNRRWETQHRSHMAANDASRKQ